LGANPADPALADDPAVKEFKSFAARYMPSLDLNNTAALPGYNNAYMIRQVLQCCGNELTRKNLLLQATTLKDIVPPMFIDGIGVYNSSADYRAIDGTTLVPLGAPVLLDSSG
jgi:branched-chain amino acid transport system substrate-binding protein